MKKMDFEASYNSNKQVFKRIKKANTMYWFVSIRFILATLLFFLFGAYIVFFPEVINRILAAY